VLFNSYQFLLLFLPVTLLGWWVFFRRPRYRLGFLALMSWIFYSAFEFPTGLMLLPLLLTSTTVDYIAGHYISRRDHEDPEQQLQRKRVLVWALGFNLALLGVFKYLGFFEGSINGVAGIFGAGDVVPVHDIILPVGISFYTFNSMSYTIDIYRRRVEPAQGLLEYSAFVALFPHLIAGPIVRYSDIALQLRNLKGRLTSKMVGVGIFFFVCGLFKKLVLADAIAPTVDRLFASSADLTVITGWGAALGYSMQLYFDFSGYSDMAVGLAMLLGLRFPQNFDSPYKALNPSDFWRRWHMTLSRWLRDYLFIPLGGSHHGKLKTLRNLFLTMFIGGLWHGAAWAFVIWGVGWGLLLVVHKVASDAGFTPPWKWFNRALCFLAAVLLWVPFRAGSMPDSFGVTGNVLGAMFGANGLGSAQVVADAVTGALVSPVFLVQVALLTLFCWFAPNTWDVELRPTRVRGLALGAAATWCLLLLTAPSPFLYFQF
jgi:alginate O-acetyltransferase complex protein AlgI